VSYLNTVKELFFLNHKEAKEAVLIKESIHINDWISVDYFNEAECIIFAFNISIHQGNCFFKVFFFNTFCFIEIIY
jgi:hypothetical protein